MQTQAAETPRTCCDCGVSEHETMICLGGAHPGEPPRLLCSDCDAQAERDWVDADEDRRHSLDAFSPATADWDA